MAQAQQYSLTVNTTPSDATVTFYLHGNSVQSGDTISVARGDQVSYHAEKEGYVSIDNTITVNNNTLLNIYLQEETVIKHRVTINTVPADAIVTITDDVSHVTVTGHTAEVPDSSNVDYTINCEGYKAVSDSILSVNADETVNVTLVPANLDPAGFNVVINTFPTDAKVLMHDVGDNFIVQGSCKVDYLLVASNFSTSNYLSVTGSNISTVTNCEVVFKIYIPKDDNATTEGRIIQGKTAGNVEKGLSVQYQKASHRCMLQFKNGSEVISCVAAEDLTPEKWYYVKWTYDANTKKLIGSNSADGTNWQIKETISNIASSKILFNITTYNVGRSNSNATVFAGKIDLSASYIKVNNQKYWSVAPSNSHRYSLDSGSQNYPTCNYIVIGNASEGFNTKSDSFLVQTDMTRTVTLDLMSGTVMLEKNVAGNYVIYIPQSRYYKLDFVGAGGGGAGEWYTYTHRWTEYHGLFRRRHDYSEQISAAIAAGGGSGSRFIGTAYLQAGYYTVTVGEGGLGQYKSNSYERIEGLVGGNTSIQPSSSTGWLYENIGTFKYIAYGGKPGVCKLSNVCYNEYAFSEESVPGFYTYRRYRVLLSIYRYGWKSYNPGLSGFSGKQGLTQFSGRLKNATNVSAHATGAASIMSGTNYGAGSDGDALQAFKAKSGYAKITVV